MQLMNLHFDTKIKRKFSIGLIVALILSANFYFSIAADQNVDDLTTAKTENQKKLDQINAQIKSYQQQIATTQAKSSSLKNEIFIYDKQIASNELQIQAKETQIEDANLQIDQLKKLIDQKTNEIEDNKQILSKLIVELNEFDDQYALKTSIGSSNLSDFLDQVQYTQNLQNKIYQLVQKIKELKAKLESQKQDLEIKVKQLQELKDQLEITQSSLTAIRSQKQALLNQTRGLESNFQKLLASSKKDEENLQKEIEDLDAKIRARLGNKSVPAAKGVLAWPMDGIMTQKYGNTGFTALGYNFHNGIDVAGPAGQPIYAAADGEVINTDHSDASYGNWVAIKHNISGKNGSSQIITLYGHMRSFKVSAGQQVKQGDLIGYEGNTGNTTKKLYGPERGYHIHFGVYDAEGFGVSNGAYTKTYGPYKVPYGYTYNPLDFLGDN
ncbi:MAG: peptidoglycan DD-metalloendopeptidase family protein [Candidatus Doudnabacteria bacterium]|nr:peptidoglycan DD-metalloendopeptidase family protein [Candidatus Doudnabacteria bacterium]